MHSAALLLEMAPNKMNQKNNTKETYVTKAQVKQIVLGVTEPKVYSSQISGANTTTAGFFFNLTNGIVEGDDINMRSGTKIEVRSITLRFRALALGSDISVRFVLFSDTMNAGTFPTTSQILPTSGIMSHYSDVRQRQQHRFRILHDEMLDLSAGGPSIKTVHLELQRKFPIYYNGSTAVATSEGKGAVSMIVIADKTTGIYDYDFQVVYNDS